MMDKNVRRIIGLGFSALLALTACTPSASTSPAATSQTASGSISSETQVKGVLPADLEWTSNPDITGVQNAPVAGDSSKPELYVSVGKLEQGTVFPAHTHPDARITTVLSGVMYYGVGDQFDQDSVTAYPEGSIVYTPPGVPHIMWAKDGEVVVEETGFGPSGATFMSDEK